ncbi:FxSxx-COOH system tetratricopeptide repeat protein, partial [Glycomyces tenuis]|uniref:FxSxx-COOH system tetratricopeptide repeat protein n=3 Tax=Glycomyces tenuis TaxID=58116 RepID=UPI0009DBAFB7
IPTLAAARQDRAVDKQLAQALNDGGGSVCLILSGMGGVGKTQIAANYALDQWSQLEVNLLVWVNASSRDTILAAFAQAGTEVCGADASDSHRATRTFLAWLAQPEAPRWLIVLDNLTDPGDLNELWPPTSQRGGTIVTTRRRDAALEGAHRTLIEVDLFTPEEARQYLIGRLKGNPIRLEQATALAADLGHLPLALAQAAAYILDQPGLTCAAYQGLLADHTIRLDDLSPDALPDGYPRSVDAAWSLSIEAANGDEPYGLAMGLLRVASLLDPAGIPADLFTCGIIFDELWAFMSTGSLHDPKRANFFVSRDITRGLGRLHRLGLIDFDGQLVRIHALIQRSIRDKLESQDLSKLANIVADALIDIWPEPEVARSTSALLRSNVDHLRYNCEPDLLERAHPLLIRQGDSLGIQGQVSSAAAYFEQLSQECLRQLGPEHGFTLEVRHRHAHWLGESGSATAASNKFRMLYQIRSKIDGPTHPDTLRARHGFARWTGEKGDLATAISELETLLQLRLEILGPDDPETLTVRHDLAYWIGQSGNPTGAVAAFGTVLAERVRLLGPDHLTTLAARQNLAYWMGEAGDLEEATAATEELLDDRMRILGHDHLDVLLTRSTLARWRGRAGEVSSAVRLNEELLEDCHRVLGPDHPFTLTTRHNLAHWRGAAGDPSAAVAQTEDLLADRIRILGPDHPDTLRTRQNLAVWTGEAGYVADAISALEQVLHDDRRVLGEDHPETLATRHNLARWQGKFGDKERAIAAFEKLLPDFDRILKPDHRYTIIARNNLDLLLNENPWDEEADYEGNISGGFARGGLVITGGLGSGKRGSSSQAPFFPAASRRTASRSTKSFDSSKYSEQEEDGDSEEESSRTWQETGNIWGYVNPKDDPYA